MRDEHPEENAVVPDVVKGDEFVVVDLAGLDDARREKRREDDGMVLLGEIDKQAPIALGAALRAVDQHDERIDPRTGIIVVLRDVETVGEALVRATRKQGGCPPIVRPELGVRATA